MTELAENRGDKISESKIYQTPPSQTFACPQAKQPFEKKEKKSYKYKEISLRLQNIKSKIQRLDIQMYKNTSSRAFSDRIVKPKLGHKIYKQINEKGKLTGHAHFYVVSLRLNRTPGSKNDYLNLPRMCFPSQRSIHSSVSRVHSSLK